jgi:predicted phage terminase large subunit-like protein
MPFMRYLCFSYAEELSLRDSGRCRDLLASEEFKMHWGDRFEINPQRDAKHFFENFDRGWRYASSTGGRTTGFRARRLICDDLHNVKDAESEPKRGAAVTWFRESLPNRMSKQSRDAIVVIMQRTHDMDVAGMILKEELDYTHLNIPMHYDSRRRCVSVLAWDDEGTPTKTWEDPRNEDGELAWPERFPESAIRELTKDMGAYAIAGQYEQMPVPRGGGIIQSGWWQDWPPAGHPERETMTPQLPAFEYVVASLDTALTQKEESDYTALTVWGVFREQMGRKRQIHPRDDDWGRDLPTFGPRLVSSNGQLVAIDDDQHPKVMLAYGWQKRLYLRGPTEPEEMRIAARGCVSTLTTSNEEYCNAGPYGLHHEKCKEYLRLRRELWGIVEWTLETCRSPTLHVDLLIIEAQARGEDVAEEIRRQLAGEAFGVHVVRPRGDKWARVNAVSHLFSNGRVFAPQLWNENEKEWRYPTWASAVIDEVTVFPRGAHDDLVDTMSAALLHLRDSGFLVRKDESISEIESELQYRPKRVPLYPV